MKGKTNNPNGRPVGAVGKNTTQMRDKINTIVENQIDNVEADLDSLEPMQRLQILEKLISYCVPKAPQPIDPALSIQLEYIEIDRILSTMPDKALEMLTKKIIHLNNIQDENQ